jgi:hypothetical protein
MRDGLGLAPVTRATALQILHVVTHISPSRKKTEFVVREVKKLFIHWLHFPSLPWHLVYPNCPFPVLGHV